MHKACASFFQRKKVADEQQKQKEIDALQAQLQALRDMQAGKRVSQCSLEKLSAQGNEWSALSENYDTNARKLSAMAIFTEASFGLWVLSLPASVCLSVRPCVYACVSITSLSTR